MDLKDSSGGGAADGIPREGRRIPTDPNIPIDLANSSTFVTATCGSAAYVCVGGPVYDAFNAKFAPGSNTKQYPYDPQSDQNSFANGAQGVALQMFNRHQLPIKHVSRFEA